MIPKRAPKENFQMSVVEALWSSRQLREAQSRKFISELVQVGDSSMLLSTSSRRRCPCRLPVRARLGIILKSLSFNYQYLVRFRWREIAIMAWFWFLACIFRGYAPKLVGGRAFLPDIFDRVEKQLTLPGIEPERTTIWYTATITMLVLVYF